MLGRVRIVDAQPCVRVLERLQDRFGGLVLGTRWSASRSEGLRDRSNRRSENEQTLLANFQCGRQARHDGLTGATRKKGLRIQNDLSAVAYLGRRDLELPAGLGRRRATLPRSIGVGS